MQGGFADITHIPLLVLLSEPFQVPFQSNRTPLMGEALFIANSHFRVSGPVCILHAAITHGITGIGTHGASCEFQWQSARETLQTSV